MSDVTRYVLAKARNDETMLRFIQSFDVSPSGCWLWNRRTHNGYGYFNLNDKHYRAHRWLFQYLHGPIPTGLQCDHLCRIRHCVNPGHIRVATQRENQLAGESFSAINARKTHCLRGHEYTPENTIIMPKGYRNCRECNLARQRITNRKIYERKRKERVG